MKCAKCKQELPGNAVYCLRCGAKLSADRRPKSRGNGQGTAIKRGKSWTAMITVGYSVDATGRVHRKTRSKGGFATKRDAVAYLPQLALRPDKPKTVTLGQLYETWLPTHRAGASTMGNYKAAWAYFKALADCDLHTIDIDDLQACMDECPRGKRTRQNMKALCGLLYKYAIPRHLATLNLAEYLIVGEGESVEKEGLPLEALEILRKQMGIIPYADYIVAQCYLGFRPSELLALDCIDYDRQQRAFVGGAKTDAGKDRIVTVSPKIQPIIDRLTRDKLSGPVFCAPDGGRMSIAVYRDKFYRTLKAAGIANPETVRDGVIRKAYTPHSCRHTFATLLKEVSAPDQDKLRIIGHTSAEMLRHYQDTRIDDLRRITDMI